MSKNILITGVSQGLGLAIAQVVIDAGWVVYGVSRRRSPEFVALQEKHGARARFLAFDLGRIDAVKENVFSSFLPTTIPLHGVVNNAAVAYDDLVSNLEIGRLRALYDLNVFAPMMITKYAIRNMLFNQIGGSIVHVSSISVHTGYKGLAMYASTKGALEAFSKNTAREWGERGIRSNCVVAGFMDTAMSSALSTPQKEKIYGRTALKQATDPVSVAAAIFYLLGDGAASMTAQNLVVDSGTI
jgi:3-oxoacyl-[acyl-carrier protein] reductase